MATGTQETTDLALHLAKEVGELVKRHLAVAEMLDPSPQQYTMIASGAFQGAIAAYAGTLRGVDADSSANALANQVALLAYSQAHEMIEAIDKRKAAGA